jgi:hypothetical protein
MSKEQERVLLHKHLTGDFPGQKWATVQALIKLGYLAVKDGELNRGTNLVVTDAGRAYCDAHHLEMP